MNLKVIRDKFIVLLDELLEGDYTKTMQETAEPQEADQSTPVAAPADPSEPVAPNPDALAPDWGSQERAYHNTRVLCDLAGLPTSKTIAVNGAYFAPKDIICACLYEESEFLNYYSSGQPVTHQNYKQDDEGRLILDEHGNKILLSTDFGLVQINDFWHIGPGKDFPSVAFVLANPDKAVEFMIEMYKAEKLGLWVSYSSGDYKKNLLPTSGMWKLAA